MIVKALSVLMALLFAFACLVSYQKLHSERQAQSREEAQRMLRAFEGHAIRLFDYADGQVRAIRAYLQEHGNDAKWEHFMAEIKAPHAELFTGIVHVVDRNGWVIYQSETPRDQLKALGKMSDLDHYQYFTKHPGDSVYIGATRLGRVTGKLQYRLARPLLKNGVFDGLVVITLLPEHITDFYRSASLGPRTAITMMTQDQKLIARQPSATAAMYGHVMSNLVKTYGISTTPGSGGSVFGATSSFDQIKRDAFYKNLADYPVTLAIGIADQDLDDELATLRQNLSWLASGFALFSLLVCALVLRVIAQNQRLTKSETATRQSASLLQASEARLQSIFAASPDALLICDAQGSICMANRQIGILLGYNIEELLSQPVEMLLPDSVRIGHPALRQDFVEMPNIRTMGKGRDLKALRKDGSECDVEISLSPIQTDQGVFVACALRDVTERKLATAELELHRNRLEELVDLRTCELAAAKDVAEAANAAKSTFVATMSHELRTPLNAVIGITRLLAESPLNRRQRDYAEKVQLSAQSLRALIDDILDFSKIEAGALHLEEANFSLNAILRTTGSILSVGTIGKPIEVLIDVAPDTPDMLIGDALRLQQILFNLTGNAVKFTEHGEIVISVRCANSDSERVTLEFAVRDTGIGIADDHLAQIFNAFAQADGSISRQYGGSGLGLTISARLAELMDGRISVDSTQGQGSEFRFTVSLGLAEGAPTAPADDNLLGLRILCIDDHPLARTFLLQSCATFGWQATAADSANAGLAELRRSTAEGEGYDLVLLDWHMPDTDGIEMLRQAQAMPGIGLPMVILMTATAELEKAIAASDDLYLDGIVDKPLIPATLFEAVKHAYLGEKHDIESMPTSTDRRLTGLRLLVAEDNELNQVVIKQMLTFAGAEIVLAGNGQIAVEYLKDPTARFDAVLMDIQMPVMDGYSATRVIREKLGLVDLPIIAVTAHARPEDRERSRRAGMVGHIVKPIDVDDLLDLINEERQSDPNPPVAMLSREPSSATNLTGLNVVAALKCLGGDERVYGVLLHKFAEQHRGDADEACQLLRSGHPAAAAKLVHDLRGVASFLQANELAALATATENALRDGHTESAQNLLDKLQAVLNKVCDTIEQFEAMLKPSEKIQSCH